MYEIITEKIIEKLESGVVPWWKPWSNASAVNFFVTHTIECFEEIDKFIDCIQKKKWCTEYCLQGFFISTIKSAQIH
ncbi:MAG: ArdC-like ssDNA-binding domain-containing protein [Bacillota bacterium]